MRGRYDDAIAVLREALTGLDANAAAGITSMVQLGCLCAIQGRSDEADRWHASTLAAAENQQHLPLLAFAFNAQGLTLRRRGRLALGHLDRVDIDRTIARVGGCPAYDSA